MCGNKKSCCGAGVACRPRVAHLWFSVRFELISLGVMTGAFLFKRLLCSFYFVV